MRRSRAARRWQRRQRLPMLRAVPHTLSEHESKELLRAAGLDVPAEHLADDADAAARAAAALGFPVVLKLCGRMIAHKTERNLVRLGLRDDAAVRDAAT